MVSYAIKTGSIRGVDSVQSSAHVVEAENLTKIYTRGIEKVHAVAGVSFAIDEADFIAIIGPSGAGKTTLLHLLGCMDVPTSGRLRIAGQELLGLNDRSLTRLRRETVGFVFQHFGLLPTLTLAENVALPTLFSRKKATSRATELLARVGLAHRRDHLPSQLSGGEMQRAAIARALINEPRILLADEPTGNLDSANGETVIELFKQLNREGLTVVVVTHNPTLAQVAARQLTLQDGRLADDTRSEPHG